VVVAEAEEEARVAPTLRWAAQGPASLIAAQSERRGTVAVAAEAALQQLTANAAANERHAAANERHAAANERHAVATETERVRAMARLQQQQVIVTTNCAHRRRPRADQHTSVATSAATNRVHRRAEGAEADFLIQRRTFLCKCAPARRSAAHEQRDEQRKNKERRHVAHLPTCLL